MHIKKTKIVLFLLIFSFLFANLTFAETNIRNIVVKNLKNSYAELEWRTDIATKANIFYGASMFDLDKSVAYNPFDELHTVTLTGLDYDEDYYYKIFSEDQDGNKYESFMQNFNTDDMEDHYPPEFNDFRSLQRINDGVALSWETNEKTTGVVEYGIAFDDLSKTKKSSKKKTKHYVFIKDLKPGMNYYFKIIAKDPRDNEASRRLKLKTELLSTETYFEHIKITDVKPQGSDTENISFEEATISWKTNMVSNTEIVYKAGPKGKNKTVDVSEFPTLYHQIHLTDLKGGTTYYYKLKATDSFRKGVTSDEYYFVTKPLTKEYVMGQHINSSFVRISKRDTIYQLYGEKKVPYYNNSFSSREFTDDMIKPIAEDHLAHYTTYRGYYGAFNDGDLIRTSKKPAVYLIEGPDRRPITSWRAFTVLGYKSEDIKVVSDKDMKHYKDNRPIDTPTDIIKNGDLVVTNGDPAVYLVEDGKRRAFLTAKAFMDRNHRWNDIKTVSNEELSQFEKGWSIY